MKSRHETCIHSLHGEETRANRLCELNVIEQVSNVCQTTIVRDAWERGQELAIHGWIYGLKDGLLRDLKMTARSPAEAETAYRRAVAELAD